MNNTRSGSIFATEFPSSSSDDGCAFVVVLLHTVPLSDVVLRYMYVLIAHYGKHFHSFLLFPQLSEHLRSPTANWSVATAIWGRRFCKLRFFLPGLTFPWFRPTDLLLLIHGKSHNSAATCLKVGGKFHKHHHVINTCNIQKREEEHLSNLPTSTKKSKPSSN